MFTVKFLLYRKKTVNFVSYPLWVTSVICHRKSWKFTMLSQDDKFSILLVDCTLFRRANNNPGLFSFPLKVPVQSGLFYLIYRQRYLRRWAPEMFAGRVVTLAALPAGNGDETESEGIANLFPGLLSLTYWKGLGKRLTVLIRQFINEKRTGTEFVPQLILGWLLWTRQWAIGQLVFLTLITVPDVFAKVNSAQFF